MSATDAYRHLTPSGMGALLDLPSDLPVRELARETEQAALCSGCALVRGVSLEEDDFRQLVRSTRRHRRSQVR